MRFILAVSQLKKVEEFIYLGTVIQSNRDIDANVIHRIRADWCKMEVGQ